MSNNVIKVNFRRNKHDPNYDREEYFRRWREHIEEDRRKADRIEKFMRPLEKFAKMIMRYYHKAGISAKACSGMDCMEVVSIFERQGFYRIMLHRIDDFPMARNTGGDIVDSVTIDGNDAFEEKTKFPRNAYIEINYHTL